MVKVLIYVAFIFFISPARCDEWNAVLARDLTTQQGSPLDLDSVFGTKSGASKFERIRSSKDGRFLLESGGSANFNCAVLAWSRSTGGMPTHGDADVYAVQLRRYGYNIVRFHYLDAHLMTGRDKDFDFDPVQLDRWHYLLARLKENGIRWVFDGMTSSNGALGGVRPHPWVKREHDLKLGVYFNPEDQEHWRELIRRLYGRVNPYTGMTPLKDPALFGMVLVNENSIDFYSPHSLGWPAPGLNKKFSSWLKEKYGSTAVLQAKWKDLDPGETLEASTITLPRDLGASGGRIQDAVSFAQDVQIETAVWMSAYLRSLGFQGVVTGYDESMKLASTKARSKLGWIDMHTYHDHVGDPIRGARIDQVSSMASSLRYVRDAAFTRLYGKPFTLTEYGQPFWNKFRYEAGPIVSVYTNFQNWDMACLYAFGVLDLKLDAEGPEKKRLIQPYIGGVDPVVRAGETVASYVLLARPFRSAMSHVAIPVDSQNLPSQVSNSYITRPTSALSLLTGVGLVERGGADLNLNLLNLVDPDLSGNSVTARLAGGANERSSFSSRVAELKKEGVLGSSNLTSAQNEIFHSDTEQIYLDVKGEVFKAVAPTAELLVANKNLGRHSLGAFTVNYLSVNGMVSFLSLDRRDLKDSARILIVLVSDARNSKMEFYDKDERVIKSLGTFPPLLRRISVEVETALKRNEHIRLRSLHLNGALGDSIVVGLESGKVKFNLDTAGYSHGPTTYFLLSRE